MGDRRVFSKDPPLPTFSFTRSFQYYEWSFSISLSTYNFLLLYHRTHPFDVNHWYYNHLLSLGLFFENQRKSDEAIMEKVGKKNTRDRVVGRKWAIGEQVIGGKERSGSERCGASNRGARDWGASDRRANKFGRKWSGSDWKKKYSKKWMRIIFLWHFVRMSQKSVDLCRKHTRRTQDGQRHTWKICRIFSLAVYQFYQHLWVSDKTEPVHGIESFIFCVVHYLYFICD